tara:strand:- start:306 stop:782 length:477 start_codon:yes stop_codon:yes gene_type:complete
MKYWKILLKEQRDKGKSGLSIPFIIGSQAYLPFKKHSKQSISELLIDISQNNSFETSLRYCMNTQTLILEVRKTKNAVYFPKYKGNEQKNLSVAISFDNLGESIEEIIKELEDRFKEPIDKQLFSAEPNSDKRTAVWRKYTDYEDIPFITNSFKKLKN